MKSKGLLIALIVSLGLNLGAAGIFAYRTFSKARFRPPFHSLKKELGLSEEQVDSITARMETSFQQTEPVREELEQKRAEMFALLKEPELDTVQVNALFAEVAELQKNLEIMVFTSLYETKDLLTAEQQAKFFEMMEKNMFKGRGPLPPMMPPGPGKPPPKGDSI
jgi:Spy/CpxP family protein refolding chaperone